MVVYKVLSIYRVLPGFREFAVFEKSKRFFYIFFGWVLHRGGQGPGKGPNIYIYQAQNRKGCLTAPLSVTEGHILIQIGKFFGILYYWVYITNLTMIGGLLLCLL